MNSFSPQTDQPLTTQREKWELGWILRGFNGPLRRARKAKGFTQKQLAEVLSVPVPTIGGIELLTRRPTPELRKNLADFLSLDEQEVWPDWLEPRDNPIEAITYQEVDAKTFSMIDGRVKKEVLQLEGPDARPEASISREMVRERLSDVMKSLTYRERTVLMLRFGLEDNGVIYTLEECARILKITRERVRCIEDKAIRKMQRPHRAKRLESAAEEVFNKPVCGTCGRLYDTARFCTGCGKQGCSRCFGRVTKEGKYTYRCEECPVK